MHCLALGRWRLKLSSFQRPRTTPLPRFSKKTDNSLADRQAEICYSSGPDNIHTSFVYGLPHLWTIHKPLTNVFNNSMRESTIPKAWKISNVTPKHMKSSKLQPCNYRPISLTYAPFKVMQRIVRVVANYWSIWYQQPNIKQNISNALFRSGRSCATQLLEAATSDRRRFQHWPNIRQHQVRKNPFKWNNYEDSDNDHPRQNDKKCC